MALVWAALQVRTDYVVLTPGPTLDVGPMISVRGVEARPSTSLFLTTVYSDMDTTVAKWIQSRVDGEAQLMPRREFVPPTMSTQEYIQLVSAMMDESKTVAKIVALQELGYDVQATGEGARVQRLLPGNMAEGILKEGDVVVRAAGQQVQTATDLVNLVRRQKPGSPISLSIEREGNSFDTRVTTRESDTEPGIAVIGILVQTHLFGHNLPVQIDIDSENIGGSSAGLMFTLGIMDVLKQGGLAAGRRIAGTGTVSLDGSVGPVGGVAQKVIGAEKAGAEYFLAPRDNAEVARRAARSIKVVEVGTVDDALAFLSTLRTSSFGPQQPTIAFRGTRVA